MIHPDRERDGSPGMLPFQSRGIRGMVCSIAVLVGLFLGFGGRRFETTASLSLVNRLGVPWPVWALLFTGYGLLLLARPATRFIGWMIGAALYGFFGVALVYAMATQSTAPPHQPVAPINPVLVGALTVVVVFHVVSGWNASRLADIDRS